MKPTSDTKRRLCQPLSPGGITALSVGIGAALAASLGAATGFALGGALFIVLWTTRRT